jgi:hypothetical protein
MDIEGYVGPGALDRLTPRYFPAMAWLHDLGFSFTHGTT